MRPSSKKNSKPVVIVTGGAGYIGSHTIIELFERNFSKVISIDSFLNSNSSSFGRIKKITSVPVVNHRVVLCNLEATKKVFSKYKNIAGVIHFAALKSVPESVADPLFYYHNNMGSLLNVLKCVELFNIPGFIFSSSCSVYGNIARLPVNEDTPLGEAVSPYAYTKQAGERIVRDFSLAHPKTNSIVLRYFNPVGAHPSALIGELPINKPNNLLPIITQTAIGKIKQASVHGNNYNTRDGTCVRDYVHVSDIAAAHVLALDFLMKKKNTSNCTVLNLGSGKGVTVLEAIRSFEKVSGKKLNYKIGPRREGDVAAIYSDSSKANKLLGWTPRFNIDQMMDSAWKWELHLRRR